VQGQIVIYILIGYMWLFVHRPFEIWPALADIHFERLYMGVAILAWAFSGRRRWLPSTLHLAYASFALAVLVCWMASPWSGTAKTQLIVENYFKLLVFYVMLVTTVRTEKDLQTICLAFIGIMGLYLAHSLREFLAGKHVYRMGIPRMVGVDSSLADPNSFSASIVYALPLVAPCWAILADFKPRWRKLLLGYVALSVFCVVETGSRGGLMSLLLCGLIYGLRSAWRFRIIAAAVVLLPLAWLAMPSHLQTRFYTVIDPSVGPENAQESADQRSEGFWIGLELLEGSPVTGCGPGAWIPATKRIIESHNLYGQVIGELGMLGLLTFPAIVLLLWQNIRSIKAPYRERGWKKDYLYYLADSIGIAIILLLFLGWGAHTLYRFNWLWYGAFLIVAKDLVDQRLQIGNEEQPDRRTFLATKDSTPWTSMRS
jgi:O-Antigen ligase